MLWKPHITVATVVARGDHFLMVEEDIEGHYVLNQPAGHLEDDETLPEAAIRETLEETAWEVELESLVGVYRWKHPASGKTFLRVCYQGRALHHDRDRSLDTGIVRAAWFSLDELKPMQEAMRSPLVMKCIQDYIKGNRYPLEIVKDII